jgi:hypothetical protein
MFPVRLVVVILIVLALCCVLLNIAYKFWREKNISWVDVVPVVFLVGVGAWQGYLEYNWTISESQYENAVQEIAPAGGVNCERFTYAFFNLGAHAGWVAWGPGGIPENETSLMWKTCQSLNGWLGNTSVNPNKEEGAALIVLTHEAMHMRGIKGEAVAQCYALQFVSGVIEELGGSRDQGVMVARSFYDSQYLHMSDLYKSKECVQGGGLDLTPEDSWLEGTNDVGLLPRANYSLTGALNTPRIIRGVG